MVTSDIEKVEKTIVDLQHVHAYTSIHMTIYNLVYACISILHDSEKKMTVERLLKETNN